jgi:hypothetical protein
MLRGVENVAEVAQILGNAVAATSGAGISRSASGPEAAMPSGATAMA